MLSKLDRAKQFLPFDALKGFREALREKEVEHVEKIELSDEIKEEIARKILLIQKDTKIEVIYYTDGQYKSILENVQKVDSVRRQIVFHHLKVNFVDILQLEILS